MNVNLWPENIDLENFWPVVCLQAAFPVRALFWKTYPGTLSPSVDFFFLSARFAAKPGVSVFHSAHRRVSPRLSHTAQPPTGAQPSCKHTTRRRVQQHRRYFCRRVSVELKWKTLLLGMFILYLEDVRVIQNLPQSLQSDDCICILLKFLQYLKTPPGHILSYPDRESTFFI